MDRRKARPLDYIRKVCAQIRVNNARARDSLKQGKLVCRYAQDFKNRCLGRLNKKAYPVIYATGHGTADSDFVKTGLQLFFHRVDLELKLRLCLIKKHRWRVWNLKREVLQVDPLQVKLGSDCVSVGCAY